MWGRDVLAVLLTEVDPMVEVAAPGRAARAARYRFRKPSRDERTKRSILLTTIPPARPVPARAFGERVDPCVDPPLSDLTLDTPGASSVELAWRARLGPARRGGAPC